MAKKSTPKKATAPIKDAIKKEVPKKDNKPKGSDKFKGAIQKYLDRLAKVAPLFAKTMQKENKNIDDCITYILNTVKASGAMGFEETEIFGMAIHYFDEDDIDIGGKIDAKVVINEEVQLTTEEIATAKAEAKQKVIDDEYARLRSNPKKKEVSRVVTGKPNEKTNKTPTLF